ncbi:hypothetical protein STRIP9103_06681 [Streptomyces ipomoeae 91-03]|uniref:Uncharacterized protein n=1 Tax=Streptomyces ipomoeae 91-03 TaxID=698759 RepID=L1KYY5_9ACTN|nr:hypothetical protein STRIP9103_06681 [Streptomyces ipomoeae 91-03]
MSASSASGTPRTPRTPHATRTMRLHTTHTMHSRVARCMAGGATIASGGDRRRPSSRRVPVKAKKSALAVAPLALMMVVGVNTQAEAVTKHWSSKPYGVTFSNYSKPLQKCIVVTLTGKMEYLWWYKKPGSKEKWVEQIRLKDPQMAMSIKGKCGRNGAPKKLTDASLSQRYYDSACKTSTAVTVSLPFAVGVTPTQKCGRIKTAKWSTKYTNNSSSYVQFNSGRKATFKKTISAAPIAGRNQACVRTDAVYTAYEGSYSDSYAKTANICVKVY